MLRTIGPAPFAPLDEWARLTSTDCEAMRERRPVKAKGPVGTKQTSKYRDSTPTSLGRNESSRPLEGNVLVRKTSRGLLGSMPNRLARDERPKRGTRGVRECIRARWIPGAKAQWATLKKFPRDSGTTLKSLGQRVSSSRIELGRHDLRLRKRHDAPE